jgi:hypothetical protein
LEASSNLVAFNGVNRYWDFYSQYPLMNHRQIDFQKIIRPLLEAFLVDNIVALGDQIPIGYQ